MRGRERRKKDLMDEQTNGRKRVWTNTWMNKREIERKKEREYCRTVSITVARDGYREM